MTFGNLLYYPGRFHSPLRLLDSTAGQGPSSQPSSSQLSNSQPEAAPSSLKPLEPLAFYALAAAEQPGGPPLLVAVVLDEHSTVHKSRELEWMAEASTGLRRELEGVMYPGCVIKTSSNAFALKIHPRSHDLFVRDSGDYSLDVDMDQPGMSADASLPVDDQVATPRICLGKLSLRTTRTNLDKGARVAGGKGQGQKHDSDTTVHVVEVDAAVRPSGEAPRATWRDDGWQEVTVVQDARVRVFKEMVENRVDQLMYA